MVPPPATTAHGLVLAVEKVPAEKPMYLVTLKRLGRVGMDWNTLGMCIGAQMVGYNQFIGRVEGRLNGLLPDAELALLRVPSLTKYYLKKQENALSDNDSEEPDEDEISRTRQEGAPIWVPWSGLWTKEGLRIMKDRERPKDVEGL